MPRYIVLLVFLASLGWGAAWAEKPGLPAVDSNHWPDEYDHYFRKYSKRYFGAHFDWQWFKAQAIAESNLNPQARSPVGALGLMQIMPSTFNEVKEKNPHFRNIAEPRWNIAAGIYYDRLLYRKWQERLADRETLMMAFASYNAGLGSIRRAYRRSPKPITSWEDVAPQAPSETRGYVRRIRQLRNQKPVARPKDKGIWAVLSGWNAEQEAEAQN